MKANGILVFNGKIVDENFALFNNYFLLKIINYIVQFFF